MRATRRNRRIAIVTGYFPPSNLAGVHRARLWSKYLPEFNWEPIVVTTHWDYYEEAIDAELLELVSPSTRVIRTPALPIGPVRIIGDIGLRALYWHFKVLDGLIRRNEVDFIHITIPSNYLAVLGGMLYSRHKFPFGVDYQDPWVDDAPKKPLSKAWLSQRLARALEPWALKHAALITGVAPSYYEGVFDRNPDLRGRCVATAAPIGNSEEDYEPVANHSPKDVLFSNRDGLFHLVYAGTMWGPAHPVLKRFLEALSVLREKDSKVMQQLRVHFIGTGKSAQCPQGQIEPYIEQFKIEPWVAEHPKRIGYLDVLYHLLQSSAILVIGSTAPHYSPSKIYQAMQAKRPIFAILHEQSSAVAMLEETQAGCVVKITGNALPTPEQLACRLAEFVRDPQYNPNLVRWSALEAHSARESARSLAGAVELALQRWTNLAEG
jgi:hypothetical protein